MKQPKSRGFIPPTLVIGDDYIFGAGQLTGEIINESGDWTPYLPASEPQAPAEETNACTCFGTSNAVETLLNYITGEQQNLSDRMIAKGAGVDPARGAVPKLAADFIRHYWSAPEEAWPMVNTVKEYYAPFPMQLFDVAKKLKGDYTLSYDYVNPGLANLKEALKRGTVCISVALMPDSEGKYYRPDGWLQDVHWLQLVRIYDNGDFLVNDSYAPYLKTIRAGFTPQAAYRYTLNEVQVDWIAQAIKAIKDFLATFKPSPAPLPAPQPPANNLVNILALAHQKHEGGKPGDLNMRLNNPGACRYSSIGYLPKYGTVSEYKTGNEKKGQRGFAHFTSYELGFLYLKNLIIEKAKKHPDWNLIQYIGDEREGWAPASDKNNVDAYAKALGIALNTTPKTFKLSQLLG